MTPLLSANGDCSLSNVATPLVPANDAAAETLARSVGTAIPLCSPSVPLVSPFLLCFFSPNISDDPAKPTTGSEISVAGGGRV